MISLFSKALDVHVTENDLTSCFVKNTKASYAEVVSESNSAANKVLSENNSATDSNKQSIVSVAFSSFSQKERIMQKKFAEKKKLNAGVFGAEHSGKKIFINDTLTKFMRDLFKRAKEVVKEKEFKFIWVRNSTILLRKKEGDKVIIIKSFVDLDKLI